jgi:hypothetical protein
MVGHSFSVKVFLVRFSHGFDSFDDVINVHPTSKFQFRRRLADCQRSNLLDVDENVTFDD